MGNEPIRFVTPKMLDAILQKLVNPMDRALLLLASEGLKTEEIVRLTIDDVDFENSLIRIQGEESVYCIPVCQKTIDECLAAHKQHTYKSLATMLEMKPRKVVSSKYIIRPINSEQCLPHMTKRGVDYRVKSVFSSQNIGITIIGGLEMVKISGILYKLYLFNGSKNEFNDLITSICHKFYYKTRYTMDEIKPHIERLYRKYAFEFENLLNNEDVIINKILSAAVHKEHETVNSLTVQLTASTDLKQISIDKAIERYLLSIEQKIPRSFQSVKKMVDKLTKWSKKNGIAFDKFSHENAISFVVSLKSPNRSEAKRYAEISSNFFKYLCATGNAAQNPFEDLDVEEVWEARNRLKKK